MVNTQRGIAGIKRLSRNPLFFGLSAGILVILINILIVSIIEGSMENGYSVFLDNGIFAYLVPPAVGVQMGLFRWHRNITAEKKLCASEKIGMTGSVTSSVTMVLCCLHHAGELLPALGFILAASSFLTEYKNTFIIIGLLANLAGSAIIAKAIMKERNRK